MYLPGPIYVVLVEPSGPLNIGSVARLCANFNVSELRLVAPRCQPQDPEAMKMAMHGSSLLKLSRHYPNLLEAISDCRKILSSCGRCDHGTIPLQTSEQALSWMLENNSSEPVALVFGREDRGLTNRELLLSHRVIRLYSSPFYPSLNLSHAVAIVLHDLARLCGTTSGLECTSLASKNKAIPAAPSQLEACLTDASDLLLETGFLLCHTAWARMAKVRGLLQRAVVRQEELALIRGMVRQLRWAIRSRHS